MTPLLFLVLKGTAVLLVAALAARLLRRAPASLRHGIWAAAFGALLLLPLLEAAGPQWAVGLLPAPPVAAPAPPTPVRPPVPPSPPAPFVTSSEAAFDQAITTFEAEMAGFEIEMDTFQDDLGSATTSFGALSEASVGGRAPQPSRGWRLSAWLVGLWAVGAGAVALWWLGAALAAVRLVRQSRPEADDDWSVLSDRARRLAGLDEPVRLLRSADLDVPIAWGFGAPAVVLPESADAWGDDRREAVLLHEMAHLRRRDAWTQAVAQAAVAVHWFNPLAWWGYRQHLDAREQACDDVVIQGGARPSAYAAHLVSVARAIRREPLALSAVAPMARTAPLETRIASILDADRRRGRLGRLSKTATVVLAVAVLVPVAAIRPVAASAPDLAGAHVAVDDAFDDGLPTAEDEAEAALPNNARTPSDEPLAELAGAAPVPEDASADTLDNVRAHIREAQEQVRRSVEDSGTSPAVAHLRLHALRQAERALEDLDIDEIAREAMEDVDVEAISRQAMDGLDLDAIRLEARAAALEGVREALAEFDAEWARSRTVGSVGSVGLTPPTPPPPPVPPVRPGPSVDWDSIDRARAAAARRSSRIDR